MVLLVAFSSQLDIRVKALSVRLTETRCILIIGRIAWEVEPEEVGACKERDCDRRHQKWQVRKSDAQN